jgi:hypothetical protein
MSDPPHATRDDLLGCEVDAFAPPDVNELRTPPGHVIDWDDAFAPPDVNELRTPPGHVIEWDDAFHAAAAAAPTTAPLHDDPLYALDAEPRTEDTQHEAPRARATSASFEPDARLSARAAIMQAAVAQRRFHTRGVMAQSDATALWATGEGAAYVVPLFRDEPVPARAHNPHKRRATHDYSARPPVYPRVAVAAAAAAAATAPTVEAAAAPVTEPAAAPAAAPEAAAAAVLTVPGAAVTAEARMHAFAQSWVGRTVPSRAFSERELALACLGISSTWNSRADTFDVAWDTTTQHFLRYADASWSVRDARCAWDELVAAARPLLCGTLLCTAAQVPLEACILWLLQLFLPCSAPLYAQMREHAQRELAAPYRAFDAACRAGARPGREPWCAHFLQAVQRVYADGMHASPPSAPHAPPASPSTRAFQALGRADLARVMRAFAAWRTRQRDGATDDPRVFWDTLQAAELQPPPHGAPAKPYAVRFVEAVMLVYMSVRLYKPRVRSIDEMLSDMACVVGSLAHVDGALPPMRALSARVWAQVSMTAVMEMYALCGIDVYMHEACVPDGDRYLPLLRWGITTVLDALW